MLFRGSRLFFVFLVTLVATGALPAQTRPSSSSSSKHARKPVSGAESALDGGTFSAGVYRNQGLGLSCTIPAGWVLRTEEMNAREEDSDPGEGEGAVTEEKPQPQRTQGDTEVDKKPGGERVLLAAFSRPPEAAGEDVNSSILIAAESVAAYPGLKEAAQYFGPVSEVARAQGFKVVEEPYEFVVGTRTLVRGDFQKDVGSRVMRQSTLVMLARGYAVSVTFIGGTEEEVEELIGGLSFGVAAKK
jgi:hypothetical protein